MWASGVKASGGFKSNCKVARFSGTTVTPSTWTKIDFQTVIFDGLGELDVDTNYRWDAAADGIYQIVAVGSIKGVPNTAGKGSMVRIYKNGAVLVVNGWEELGTPSQNLGIYTGRTPSIAVTTVELNAGDYIEMFVYHNHTGNLLAEGCNYCTIKRIA
ncbi:hypothetical protein LCGC14_2260290 [marine sediment metagenome]|uniref:PA14 domain-containing protein n=1 Tax=marine sediment metagenome TaxID=412755 RepID=A0A0F9FC99_9ZZZZ